jgi:hypothetical protein
MDVLHGSSHGLETTRSRLWYETLTTRSSPLTTRSPFKSLLPLPRLLAHNLTEGVMTHIHFAVDLVTGDEGCVVRLLA